MDIVSAFPLPPAYYKTAKDLEPPPIPSPDEQIFTFGGEPLNIQSSLETLSILQFVSKISSLISTINSCFRSAVEASIQGKANGTALTELLNSIRESFFSIHHAINQQRKVEALFRIIAALNRRIESKKQLIQELDHKMLKEPMEMFAEYTQIPRPRIAFHRQSFEQAMHQRIQALIKEKE